MNEALRRRLQQDRLAELLTEMDTESAPIPDAILDEARQVWRGDLRPVRRGRG